MSYSIFIPVVASVVLAPLLVRLWSRLAPPAGTSDFDHLDFEMLRERWLPKKTQEVSWQTSPNKALLQTCETYAAEH